MERKAVFGIILLLLLIDTLTIVFNVHLVKASGTIYLRADGTVDPPSAPIQRDGNLYQITKDINCSIIVERDNIIIDGNNNSLLGEAPNFIGIDIPAILKLHFMVPEDRAKDMFSIGV